MSISIPGEGKPQALQLLSIRSLRPAYAALAANANLTIYCGVFTLIAASVLYLNGRAYNPEMAGTLLGLYSVMVPIFAGILIVFAFLRTAIYDRPESPTRHLIGQIKAFTMDAERIAGIILKSVLVVLFMSTFSFMKDMVPILNPFSWDRTFQEIDRAMFFGHDGWQLTFMAFGTPLATTVINTFYHAWLFVIYMFLLSAIFGVMRRDIQQTFLYAFMITWSIGGILLATLLSSAGPVYFARLGFGNDFEPLMQMLHQFDGISPVMALWVQDQLWATYSGNGGGIISGITAMPSMHVASTTVVTLAAYATNRKFGHVMAFFTAMIFIGSVHLGWHYACDGLLGMAVAVGSWKISRLLAPIDLARRSRALGEA